MMKTVDISSCRYITLWASGLSSLAIVTGSRPGTEPLWLLRVVIHKLGDKDESLFFSNFFGHFSRSYFNNFLLPSSFTKIRTRFQHQLESLGFQPLYTCFDSQLRLKSFLRQLSAKNFFYSVRFFCIFFSFQAF